ncbi:hypothetical protein E2320_002563 [Naja naja]|nr:hypothetical protein E2320_002563 [Naja naja]
MAAYHWEARRKQIIMEHRLRLMQESRIPEESEQQVSNEKTQNCTIPLDSNMTSQNLPVKEIKQDRCLCQTEHVPSQSGKLLKRYKASGIPGGFILSDSMTHRLFVPLTGMPFPSSDLFF